MEVKKVSTYLTQAAQRPADQNARSSGADDKTAAKDVAAEADSVKFSSGYQEMAQAKKVMTEGADVRAEKVESLRNQVNNGSYEINADKIAGKMLDEVM